MSLCTALSVNWIGKYPVSDYRKSSIKFPLSNKPNLSNKLPPLLFRERKLISHSPPCYSSLINDRLYWSITTVELCVDWTDPGWFIHQLEVQIYFWSLATWPPSFSTLYSSSLWRTDTIVFAELNKHPLSNKPPSLVSTPPPPQTSLCLKYISPPRGLNRGSTVSFLRQNTLGGLQTLAIKTC